MVSNLIICQISLILNKKPTIISGSWFFIAQRAGRWMEMSEEKTIELFEIKHDLTNSVIRGYVDLEESTLNIFGHDQDNSYCIKVLPFPFMEKNYCHSKEDSSIEYYNLYRQSLAEIEQLKHNLENEIALHKDCYDILNMRNGDIKQLKSELEQALKESVSE